MNPESNHGREDQKDHCTAKNYSQNNELIRFGPLQFQTNKVRRGSDASPPPNHPGIDVNYADTAAPSSPHALEPQPRTPSPRAAMATLRTTLPAAPHCKIPRVSEKGEALKWAPVVVHVHCMYTLACSRCGPLANRQRGEMGLFNRPDVD
jgi:hypothetical protein